MSDWQLTRRGVFVVSSFMVLLILAAMGVAGWIEGGCV